ncbi:hypothetical protein HYS54_02340, partial [Candidatus Micrarchaeota archaeon]|nr:hypothetical protein [Candidatus Micrarchaeota archaeon]
WRRTAANLEAALGIGFRVLHSRMRRLRKTYGYGFPLVQKEASQLVWVHGNRIGAPLSRELVITPSEANALNKWGEAMRAGRFTHRGRPAGMTPYEYGKMKTTLKEISAKSGSHARGKPEGMRAVVGSTMVPVTAGGRTLLVKPYLAELADVFRVLERENRLGIPAIAKLLRERGRIVNRKLDDEYVGKMLAELRSVFPAEFRIRVDPRGIGSATRGRERMSLLLRRMLGGEADALGEFRSLGPQGRHRFWATALSLDPLAIEALGRLGIRRSTGGWPRNRVRKR